MIVGQLLLFVPSLVALGAALLLLAEAARIRRDADQAHHRKEHPRD